MNEVTTSGVAVAPGKQRFSEMYASGGAKWDTGRPQPEIVRLHRDGWIRGDVLDLGCGTGENALYLAAEGCRVVGVDFVRAAIDTARRKAKDRGVQAEFHVADALAMDLDGRRFDAVVDSGVFHVFDDSDRERYVNSVRCALREAGRLALLCFSELQPGAEGPRRVSEEELRAAFARGWRIEALGRGHFEHDAGDGLAEAWVLRATRLEE